MCIEAVSQIGRRDLAIAVGHVGLGPSAQIHQRTEVAGLGVKPCRPGVPQDVRRHAGVKPCGIASFIERRLHLAASALLDHDRLAVWRQERPADLWHVADQID